MVERSVVATYGYFARGQCAAEIFARSSRVACAWARRGVPAKALDMSFSFGHDITLLCVHRLLMEQIRRGYYGALHFGVPCRTCSRARSPPLRSTARPWGLSGLGFVQRCQVREANRVYIRFFQLLAVAFACGVPCCVGNPNAAILWSMLEWRHFVYRDVVADYCQWGTPWRKATRFRFFNVPPGRVAAIARRCSGRRGRCSRTKMRHVVLRGRLGGRNLTSIAEPYPEGLASALAAVLVP